MLAAFRRGGASSFTWAWIAPGVAAAFALAGTGTTVQRGGGGAGHSASRALSAP
jgi:hypothetical protein